MMKTLPCFPCPHASSCCWWGVTISLPEMLQMVDRFGLSVITTGDPGELRTAVVDGRCVFLQDNACTIHDTPFYPQVCRGFPFTDAEHGGAYEGDTTICPEMLGDHAPR